ncbi:hypothetical protein [Phenylobacterium sp.]|uniref:hypothetical protein n=1 Tax=Phenylobacterium sp. TaxID=1871053 RepID=UPI002FD89EBD
MEDRHYPLGFVQGASEILDGFGAEAEAIGVITILWNRHELRLRDIFERLLEPVRDFAAAVWEGENTHQGRAKLLRLAARTMQLSAVQAELLDAILERTASLSEKRNALAHAEYVVDLQSDALVARARRRQKPPIYHPSDLASLSRIIEDLREVDAIVGALSVELAPDDLKQSIAAVAASFRPPTGELG